MRSEKNTKFLTDWSLGLQEAAAAGWPDASDPRHPLALQDLKRVDLALKCRWIKPKMEEMQAEFVRGAVKLGDEGDASGQEVDNAETRLGESANALCFLGDSHTRNLVNALTELLSQDDSGSDPKDGRKELQQGARTDPPMTPT